MLMGMSQAYGGSAALAPTSVACVGERSLCNGGRGSEIGSQALKVTGWQRHSGMAGPAEEGETEVGGFHGWCVPVCKYYINRWLWLDKASRLRLRRWMQMMTMMLVMALMICDARSQKMKNGPETIDIPRRWPLSDEAGGTERKKPTSIFSSWCGLQSVLGRAKTYLGRVGAGGA